MLVWLAAFAALAACGEPKHPRTPPAMVAVEMPDASLSAEEGNETREPIGDAGPVGSGPVRLGKPSPEAPPDSPRAAEDAGAGSLPLPGVLRTKVAQIVPGAKQVQGRMSADVIERIVRLRYPRIRACYELGLKKDPTLSGKVTMTFLIGKKATKPKVFSSTVPDQSTNDCIARQFAAIVFPRPTEGEVDVTYPFDLVPPLPSSPPSGPAVPNGRRATGQPAHL